MPEPTVMKLIPALLVAQLCAACPLQQLDDEGNPDCLLHLLAAAHADALAQRYPHTGGAVQASSPAPDAPTVAGAGG